MKKNRNPLPDYSALLAGSPDPDFPTAQNPAERIQRLARKPFKYDPKNTDGLS